MEKLYLVMPAYNEECNIKEVVESWYPVLDGKSEDSRIVIADSGSSDKTHIILEQLQRQYTKLQVLSDTAKEHGPKVIALYAHAIEAEADYIFQTDSDGQTNPEEFEEFWKLREQYDVVLGNRRIRGDGRIRKFVEYVVCVLLKLYFGVKVPDANAPFRLMKAETVKKYLYRLPKEYNLPNIMMTVYFVYYKEKFLFKEISFRPRQGGRNFINIHRIFKIGWQALHDFFVLRKEMKE